MIKWLSPPYRFLQFGKIDDHPRTVLPFDYNLHLVGVAVQLPAFVVPGDEVGTVDVIDDSQFHGAFLPNSFTAPGRRRDVSMKTTFTMLRGFH